MAFGDEVEFIWMKEWTLAKMCYAIGRYLPWLAQLGLLGMITGGTYTPSQCKKWITMEGVIVQLLISSVDLILIIRVYALYNRNRILLCILSTIYAGLIGVLCFALSTIIPRMIVDSHCASITMPVQNYIYWLPSLSFETILFALTLYKVFESRRLGWRRSPILHQFVRDGTWAFALIFAAMLAITITYSLLHSPLTGVCFPWLWTAASIVSARLVLDPRRSFNQSLPTPRLSGIELEVPDTPTLPESFLETSDTNPDPS
ncbi:hypothetical protein NEOLEDRAFT_1182742 [Neolentinus lepideus HHB14362 ss-1]|uniref:DUF6533 domain-containing protein n=1 Tax=Neolentinus lepideus HHB14362 ss-1 TaxID=1314782 RepID=A0A165NWU1_9AGAM|nr:hypothetical protein NEOLEDRAFT_1182742 [Neolentinus lepideus HHB14362 ss-1]